MYHIRKTIVALINTHLRPLGIVSQRLKDVERSNERLLALTEMITGRIQGTSSSSNPQTEGIVFSKDRALQLDALLCSYRDMVKSPVPLHLLFAASSARHLKAYKQVIDLHRSLLTIVEEQNVFQAQVVSMLERVTSPTAFFLVDDIVFIRPVDFAILQGLPGDSFVVSLRMAPHLSRCYTLEKAQPLPEFRNHESGLMIWRWKEGRCDWGYPLSLDGHCYATAELRAMVRHARFTSPNSLELALQGYNDLFMPRFGACFPESRILNIPVNKVQTEIDNRSGGIHQDELLVTWEKGMRMDYRKFYNVTNESAHQELPIRFIKRV